MSGRVPTFAIRVPSARTLPAIALSLATLGGCCGGGWEDESTVLELGVDADLEAVVGISDVNDTHDYDWLAVGSGGTVVAWGHVDDEIEPSVTVFSLGDADLHAVWAESTTWWVVGDDGTAAVSGDLGQTWAFAELGTAADLHAITSVGSRLTIVGDNVVLVQAIDGTWSETPAPADGWGQLRDVYYDSDSGYDGGRMWVVGLGGVIWSAEDPGGEWVAEASGVSSDLFAVGKHRERGHDLVAAVGAAGTVLVRDAEGWTRSKSRERVDLIDYHDGGVLGAGGEVFELDTKRKLSHVDTFAGARGLRFGGGVLVVGDGGMVASKGHFVCVL